MYFEFKNSVKIIAGDDALSNLSYELKLLDCRKPLFLTDAILEKLGTLDIVRKELKDIDNSKVYSDIPVDSSIHTIEKIKEFYSKNSCDGIIAVGGGVVTDLAGFVAGTFGRGVPFIKTSPFSGCKYPVSKRRKVVFPDPFIPWRTVIDPFLM